MQQRREVRGAGSACKDEGDLRELGCHMQISDRLWPGSYGREDTGTGLVGCGFDARDGHSGCITANSCGCKSEADNLTEARGGIAVVPSGDNWWPDSRVF